MSPEERKSLLFALADCEDALDEWDLADAALREVLAIDPVSRYAQDRRTLLLLKMHDDRAASATADDAIASASSWIGYLVRGILRLRR